MTVLSAHFGSGISEFPPNSQGKTVCHCLHISQDEIEHRIESGAATSVKCVLRETGAGSGCTACHCTIRSLLEAAGHSVQCLSPHMQPQPACEPVPLVG